MAWRVGPVRCSATPAAMPLAREGEDPHIANPARRVDPPVLIRLKARAPNRENPVGKQKHVREAMGEGINRR